MVINKYEKFFLFKIFIIKKKFPLFIFNNLVKLFNKNKLFYFIKLISKNLLNKREKTF